MVPLLNNCLNHRSLNVNIVSLGINHWNPSTWTSDLSTIVMAWLHPPQWSGFASKEWFLSQFITLADEACLKLVKYCKSMVKGFDGRFIGVKSQLNAKITLKPKSVLRPKRSFAMGGDFR